MGEYFRFIFFIIHWSSLGIYSILFDILHLQKEQTCSLSKSYTSRCCKWNDVGNCRYGLVFSQRCTIICDFLPNYSTRSRNYFSTMGSIIVFFLIILIRFKEIKGRRNILFLFATFVIMFTGVGLIVASRYA